LVALGLLELREGKPFITQKGKEAGGEFRVSPRFGAYFLWPETWEDEVIGRGAKSSY